MDFYYFISIEGDALCLVNWLEKWINNEILDFCIETIPDIFRCLH